MAVRELSPKGQAFMDDLPPFYAESEETKAVQDALARELQRVEDAGEALRFKFFPQNADDEFRLLGMWEWLLGLPVESPGASISDRRDFVLGVLRARKAGTGASWVALVSRALGTTAWSYTEGPGDYQVTIEVPFGSTSYTGEQIKEFVRAITPANLEIIFSFGEGFILDSSGLGDPL